MEIRSEEKADHADIRRVNEAAFGRPDEADLVDRLRARAKFYISLVAVDGSDTVGHIAFSEVTLDPPQPSCFALGLAPMAVLPARQRSGVGSALVHEGLEVCKSAGADLVFVLGHPDYYPRFGFESAAARQIDNEYGAPPEAFMVLELTPHALGNVKGMAQYDRAFAGLE